VQITFDQVKRNETFSLRGMAFEDAEIVFLGKTVEIEDTRKNYGEVRVICFGKLQGRMVVVGYTQRNDARHVFSMRKANQREQNFYGTFLEE
jgi:uncharacterized protein